MKNNKIVIIFFLLVAIIVLAVIIKFLPSFKSSNNIQSTVQGNMNNNVQDDTKDSSNTIYEIDDEYTQVEIFGAIVKFNRLKDTTFWYVNDDFGAAEIDGMFMYSKEGKEIEDYLDVEKEQYIVFQTSNMNKNSQSDVKNKMNTWYNISDPKIETLENNIFSHKVSGESSKYYVESYFFEYDGEFYGEEVGGIDYQITLVLDKNGLSKSEIEKAKYEFNVMIDTFEFVSKSVS